MKIGLDSTFVRSFIEDEESRTNLFLIISGISLVISFFQPENLPVDVAWVAVILCGIPILKEAAVGLYTNFDIKAGVLVSLALIAAVSIGEIFAAGEIAVIMAFGELLEERTVAKARAGIEKLVRLTPRTARVVRSGIESVVPAEQVRVGDRLRVLAGEVIAVDGIIISGQTSIDQSIMTGESLPVDKDAGDEVSSGTVNQFGTFEMRATKVGEDSSVQRMVRLVQSADAGKAKIARLADRWTTWLVVIALTTAVLTWFLTGEIIRAVTVLVVFCPCALVLATPTAIVAGIGNAAKYGILVREGDALERLAKVTRIAFDKTGTLTYGKPSVVRIESFDAAFTPDELLSLAASAELRSEHPLGKALVQHFRSNHGSCPREPDAFRMLAGRGVCADVNGRTVLAGNEHLLIERSVALPPEIPAAAERYRDDGCTVIYVAVDSRAAGIIALSDTLRSDSAETIMNLHRLGVGSVLLTGDNQQAANHMAGIAKIEVVHANCLPEGKMAVIEQYQKNNELICMVGDGINDAPALKTANVGVAMGGVGSDIAIDAADIALVSDDIVHIPHLLGLSRRIMRTINLNIIFSMALNFGAVILAMTGILNPVYGALVHNAGSIVVVLNSATLLNWKDKKLDRPKPGAMHLVEAVPESA